MMHHLNLRDLTLDASSAANAIDGLDLDLVKYADHDVVRDIMRSDVTDLKQRASSVEAKLQSVELESIKDYVAESDNLVALHGQIEGCDAILREMESLLLGFKNDLGKISSEIKSLQDQSSTMGTKLRNRKAAEYSLGAFVEDEIGRETSPRSSSACARKHRPSRERRVHVYTGSHTTALAW